MKKTISPILENHWDKNVEKKWGFFVCSSRFVGGLPQWMECEGASPGGQTHETTLIPALFLQSNCLCSILLLHSLLPFFKVYFYFFFIYGKRHDFLKRVVNNALVKRISGFQGFGGFIHFIPSLKSIIVSVKFKVIWFNLQKCK